ncbi:MAG: hypothetical protein K1X79_04020 [Oligoflexia bacterium]|nr:hypothetical protein [Oligoflexia bacterium]
MISEQHFKPHHFDWIVERLREHPSYLERQMFSCRACYCHGKLMLVLADSEAPDWMGLLVPTERDFHTSLKKEFSELLAHPVLGKWLYLREDAEHFEDTAIALARLALSEDPRLGVLPSKKRKRKKSPQKRIHL